MKQYAKQRKKQGESIKEKTTLLQQLNIDLITQKKQKEVLIKENRLAKTKLKEEKKNQELLMVTLKQSEGKFATQIRKKQKEAAAIDKQIEALIRAAIAKSNTKSEGNTTTASKSTKFALTPEAKALAANFTSNKGRLIWPVEKGVVTESYGTHQHRQFPNVTTNNNGVDITTESSAKARAVFDGEVMQIQQIKGANQAIYIRHGDYITIYRNLGTVSVKPGDKVKTKQEIGTIFNNPTSGKTTLKFYIYRNANKMNPADWIYKM
jgi:septal ring factor EnvC (AmiA/AmiB activator)